MRDFTGTFGVAVASLSAMLFLAPVEATETNVWLNLEGNPTCSALGDNQAVLEARDNGPNVGSNSITSPRIDVNGNVVGTQTINYEVVVDPGSGGYEISTWSVDLSGGVTLDNVNPVNFTILKGKGNNGARVFHFGGLNEGAISDTDESAPNDSQLSAVSFCYGLTVVGFDNGSEPPVALTPIPQCETLIAQNSNLDGTGIACEVGGPERLLINMEMNAANFGFDDQFHACTCNVEGGLQACDPDARVGDANACVYACDPDAAAFLDDGVTPNPESCDNTSGTDGVAKGINAGVPVTIEGVENPDSYICYTIGGRRYCYGHY